MGLMVVHGAQGGGFSPISIYGGITNKIVAKAGLPLNEMATMLASLGVNLAVSLLLFFLMGGMKLLRQKADVDRRAARGRARVAHGAGRRAGVRRRRRRIVRAKSGAPRPTAATR